MSNPLAVPKASDDPVEHADWLELRALEADDRNASLTDLSREITRSGTTDAIPAARGETRTDKANDVASNAIDEIQDRIDSANGEAALYPFKLIKGGQVLQMVKGGENSLHMFLLLLTHIDVDREKVQEGIDGTQLFEDICAAAASSYIGGDHPHVGHYVIGAPRRGGPASFGEAINVMCKRMGEGVGHRSRDNLTDKKDGGLDLVVWRAFSDKRTGKLICFAQCKTGRNWEAEVRNLQSHEFCADWLQEMPIITPVRMFFVPCRVSRYGRHETCRAAGILFDRCRIVEYSADLSDERRTQWRKWSNQVIQSIIYKKVSR